MWRCVCEPLIFLLSSSYSSWLERVGGWRVAIVAHGLSVYHFLSLSLKSKCGNTIACLQKNCTFCVLLFAHFSLWWFNRGLHSFTRLWIFLIKNKSVCGGVCREAITQGGNFFSSASPSETTRWLVQLGKPRSTNGFPILSEGVGHPALDRPRGRYTHRSRQSTNCSH